MSWQALEQWYAITNDNTQLGGFVVTPANAKLAASLIRERAGSFDEPAARRLNRLADSFDLAARDAESNGFEAIAVYEHSDRFSRTPRGVRKTRREEILHVAQMQIKGPEGIRTHLPIRPS